MTSVLFKNTHAHRNFITQDVPARRDTLNLAPLFLQTMNDISNHMAF